MGKVAVVTGGASGLGLSVVERFAREGYKVVIVDLATGQGEAHAKRLSEEGRDVHFISADVSRQANAKEAAERIYQQFGGIHVLVNSAGIIRRKANVDVPDEELNAVLNVNLNGTVYMSQAVQPYMAKSGGGAICNMASMLAHYGSKNLLSYAASKGGVVQVTKCLAVDWAEHHIRVNAVSPGYIETPLSSGATRDPAFNERILSRTPQRRYGKPEEVAAAIYFLCSDEASFITGVVLPIDGGLLAGDPSLFPPAAQ
ncbi:SDR family NAD(P)-dependent oxidoreductase [Xylanibacillus composti]|uniref:3-oxoacyl-[acyl-carrier-protein] reductase FabG n=1 Tax=Xylanibacillus composti TaxID=1572762 RepID=A0A8J4H1C4_9BACL|nr:SDR family oxidoreductase [Xylanibacillus composti]MDT9723908.1 SDR family NAD(P)-dependent oxidoreductase [Xylanibacillus composti]GIQ67786.1 3-oxoacyl-[acyl-carrier-protein] reductase FabG [Xylanibacillus composti]